MSRVAIAVVLAAGLAIFSLACSREEPAAAAEPAAAEPAAAEPAVAEAAAEPAAEPAATEAATEPAADDGKQSLEGTAQNAKMGAVLVTAEGNVWVDLDAWPDDLVGTKLKVVGRMITKSDVPVVDAVAGEPAAAGVPVEDGQDKAEAATREVLSDVSWTAVK